MSLTKRTNWLIVILLAFLSLFAAAPRNWEEDEVDEYGDTDIFPDDPEPWGYDREEDFYLDASFEDRYDMGDEGLYDGVWDSNDYW